MEIITDHKWKFFKYQYEVPEKVLKEDFDWLGDESDGFIYYRKRWYHLQEFMDLHNKMYVPESPFPPEWDGYISDSFFSGILIKLSDDGESYKIGTYIS